MFLQPLSDQRISKYSFNVKIFILGLLFLLLINFCEENPLKSLIKENAKF